MSSTIWMSAKWLQIILQTKNKKYPQGIER